MKNILMKISAMLFAIWYCLSIIGFDVHTCSETGSSFVHMSFTSHSCHEIHDDHCDHEHGHDCDNHCEDAEEHHHDDDCCEDEYQVISLTGLRSDDDSKDSFQNVVCPCIFDSERATFSLYADLSDCRYLEEPDSGLIVPDAQAYFAIWRI